MRLGDVIAKQIIAARRHKGWSQTQLALKSGISPGTMSRYEKGRRQRVSVENLIKIANATGVTVDFLLGRFD